MSFATKPNYIYYYEENNNDETIIHSDFLSPIAKGDNFEESNKKRKSASRLKFTEDEDQKLLMLVNKYGEKNWKKISKIMKNRTIRQCRDRYRHYISPGINRSPWNDEEDSLLLEKVEELGERWKILEKFFKNRTEVQIRNRYYTMTHCNIEKIKNKEIPRISDDVHNYNNNSKHPKNTDSINQSTNFQENETNMNFDDLYFYNFDEYNQIVDNFDDYSEYIL
ncbi:Myb-like DNA-binding domain containing protein [Tritrichomonas foetus]|uniref:Myb-like DNA-binding domain containing protein n=1 Tax=Tritrichomonas foetus TaxID=1144522 RepID=A0A1J4JRY5_9EUKA|nr:Myb-like DNA-binding domain containing protein [Tritrichomonas foetus]|eukprot:OHT01903.1 Myb-like DNA-binding domain containing protein [Tritrichomonas foetus]